MQATTRTLLETLGCELSLGLIMQTQAVFAEQVAPPDAAVRIMRDLAYGPHERHRLDLFHAPGTVGAPVFVFVHGGSFVGGDKTLPNLPFYENVGCWAARQGWVGVVINYRLAPDHLWPSGAEDVAAALAWLDAHVANHGGDPARIVLMGQSAGAAHVGTYLASPQLRPANGARLAGAVLVSGVYDIASSSPNAYHLAYYGTDRTRYAACSMVEGLAASDVPLCLAVAEHDGRDQRRQAARLVGAFGKVQGDMPRLHWLPGHNHLSTILAIGTPDDTLGPHVADFVARVVRD